jgi:hypothetical protein
MLADHRVEPDPHRSFGPRQLGPCGRLFHGVAHTWTNLDGLLKVVNPVDPKAKAIGRWI